MRCSADFLDSQHIHSGTRQLSSAEGDDKKSAGSLDNRLLRCSPINRNEGSRACDSFYKEANSIVTQYARPSSNGFVDIGEAQWWHAQNDFSIPPPSGSRLVASNTQAWTARQQVPPLMLTDFPE